MQENLSRFTIRRFCVTIKKWGDEILNINIPNLLMAIPGIIIAITLHEYVKSLTAYRLGDKNVKTQGRLALNPFKHMDILGGLFLLFFGYGWANPVRLQPFSFADHKKSMLFIFLVPFLTNFIVGTAFAIAARLFAANFEQLAIILLFGAMYNFSFALFNLIPIHPMDGIHLLGAIKPMWAVKISQREKILQIFLAFFIVMGFAHMVFGSVVTALMDALVF